MGCKGASCCAVEQRRNRFNRNIMGCKDENETNELVYFWI